ncbi:MULTISPECIES: LacI family DNA-binding transcriptional regulator [unclassified Paenibacillus]|uniref:LacI family DNA-binding transcriptional regulator n=1 Tax=unclassified Paenibacillus TaxID=185978 RepID=UPI00278A53F1|nr:MULTISPECIES: LacI family DNA-binding transcriptional regulator [unclassified Paenibacillus]MDQ0900410.1 LacI family transcriptional regulator [Paenibacillus sp. V4I7]MDQ0921082.1 LacI family transcriptional regulator [Paenibacillus sp. V4I5]
MEAITVYDIAREANVSVATVSRVLNDTAPVRTSTRQKIMAIIEKHKFQPNALARSLVNKKTGMIGVLFPDSSNMFFPEVFGGAERAAMKLGFTLFLCNTFSNFSRESEYLNLLCERQVEGLIFMGGRINSRHCPELLVQEVVDIQKRIPIVLINGSLPGHPCHRVKTDEYVGTQLIMQHLIDRGHRSIGFLGGGPDTTTTMEKLQAYKSTLGANDLPFRKQIVRLGDFTMECGRKLMDQFLTMPNCPTAFLCINDYVAIGAMKAAISHGLRIPEDIAIAGFDDTQLASAMNPELTTVSQHSEELGNQAMALLSRLIQKEKVKKLTVLEPKLIVRQST